MAFFDGTGSFGLGLGGIDISDTLGFTTPDVVTPKVGDFTKVGSPSINNTGAPVFDAVNNPKIDLGIKTQEYSPDTSTQSGLGFNSKNLVDLAGFGVSAWNDYQNRKNDEKKFNFNVTSYNNKRARDEAIARQLGGASKTYKVGKDQEEL